MTHHKDPAKDGTGTKDTKGAENNNKNKEEAAEQKSQTCPAEPTAPEAADDSSKDLDKLQAEIEELRKAVKERDEFLKLSQRIQADFANYQKRIRRDKECWEKYKDEDLLKQLIPALDNLDRAVKVECKSDDAKCLLDGVGLTKQEVFRVLDKNGVKEIKTLGEKFDPTYHESVGTVESADRKEGEIVEEMLKGFMLHDRVLRPAKVRIAVLPKQVTEERKDEGTKGS